jgi:MraZ protein
VSGIDAKGRTTIPAELRDTVQLSSEANMVCLSRHAELPCLIGFGRAERQKLRADIEAQWQASIARGEDFDRETAGLKATSIFETAFEPSGRFVIQPMLRHFGKLEDRAFYFGTVTHFQLWNPDVFLAEAPNAYASVKEELSYWLTEYARRAR